MIGCYYGQALCAVRLATLSSAGHYIPQRYTGDYKGVFSQSLFYAVVSVAYMGRRIMQTASKRFRCIVIELLSYINKQSYEYTCLVA